MVRRFMIAAVSAAVIALSPAAFGQQTGGTAEEAKAILMKAVAAVRADKAKALDMFNKGKADFGIEISTCFVQMLATAQSLRLAIPNSRKPLAQTCAPLRTPRASRLARKCTRRFRSRKVNHRGQLYAAKAGRRL
jgi:hypothetical protein